MHRIAIFFLALTLARFNFAWLASRSGLHHQ
jgi:hypothetical protein